LDRVINSFLNFICPFSYFSSGFNPAPGSSTVQEAEPAGDSSKDYEFVIKREPPGCQVEKAWF
jgi:hypothetical protein